MSSTAALYIVVMPVDGTLSEVLHRPASIQSASSEEVLCANAAVSQLHYGRHLVFLLFCFFLEFEVVVGRLVIGDRRFRLSIKKVCIIVL